MANLLQSSQNKTTCAPSYYTNYLTNLATKGQAAACQAQYVGAQPLQTEAFCKATTNFGAQQPTYQTGLSVLGCAANQQIAGAATPYLQQAATTNTGQLAQCYMSPYINNAVQNLSDIAQRNIQQNIAPNATAAAVGSGQFGSQRGAQVLGQVEANAEQCLNSQIANLENTGYANALTAATQKQALLGQLGSTASTAQAECARAKQAAGLGMGTIGTQAAAQNLACINALSTLGAQQQAIGQNAQCFCLAKEAKVAGLLQGASIPTSVKTTMCMSPLSAIGAVGAGALGILCKYPSIICKVKGGLSGLIPTPKVPTLNPCNPSCVVNCQYCAPCNPNPCNPSCTYKCQYCGSNSACGYNMPCGESVGSARGGSIRARNLGAVGCKSTYARGGLVFKG